MAALAFGATGGFADGGVSVFRGQLVRRTTEAGADLIAALGLRAHAPVAIHLVGVIHRSGTTRALEGVAVDRVWDFIMIVVIRIKARDITRRRPI